jgi:hypothetical protein
VGITWLVACRTHTLRDAHLAVIGASKFQPSRRVCRPPSLLKPSPIETHDQSGFRFLSISTFSSPILSAVVFLPLRRSRPLSVHNCFFFPPFCCFGVPFVSFPGCFHNVRLLYPPGVPSGLPFMPSRVAWLMRNLARTFLRILFYFLGFIVPGGHLLEVSLLESVPAQSPRLLGHYVLVSVRELVLPVLLPGLW